jgi:thioesterase domain-containing protein
MAQMLRKELPPARATSAIPLKHGSRRPLFFVHGAGGSPFSFVDLAHDMPTDRPFVAFQDMEPRRPDSGEDSIPSMAARYIEVMRSLQAQGPYLLGGWSMGGVVAFEMASQLLAAGQPIGLLALIDSYLAPLRPRRNDGLEVKPAIDDFLLSIGIKPESGLLTNGKVPPQAHMEMAHSFAVTSGVLPLDFDRAAFDGLFDVFCRHVRASESYHPVRADLTAHLWQANELNFVSGNTDDAHPLAARLVRNDHATSLRRWRKLTAAIHVSRVPGNHFSMLRDPHVRTLATGLAFALDRAEANSSREPHFVEL